jgi:GT2 family glycosyltransferase
MTVTAPSMSVVVPTYQRQDLLERCLVALLAQDYPADRYEIIVADDGPSEATRDLVARFAAQCPNGPALVYVPVVGTQGPAAARNRGWERARAEVIAFTDDDTVPAPMWLTEGEKVMAGGPAAAMGRIEMPLPPNPTDFELDSSGLTRAEFATANCFVRKSVLKEIGGFDERFTMAWREDSDLQFMLLSRGHTIVNAPAALVVHPVRSAPRGVSVSQQKKVCFDALLHKKHPTLFRERIRRGPPWSYIVIVLSLLALIIALAIDNAALGWVALTVWAALTLRFFALRIRHTSRDPAHVIEMLVTSILIPPLSIFWGIVGALRFRTALV